MQKDTEVVLSKKLEEVSQQLRKTEGQKDTLSTEMQKAQTECHALKTQLKELEKTLSGANENSKGLQAKLEVLSCCLLMSVCTFLLVLPPLRRSSFVKTVKYLLKDVNV